MFILEMHAHSQVRFLQKKQVFQFPVVVIFCCFRDDDNCPLSQKPASASHQRRRSCGGSQKLKWHHNYSPPISHPSTTEEACKLVDAGFE